MLKHKTYHLLIISTLFFYSNLFADTCPDMSNTSSAPSGWILTLGKPLSHGNQFAGATWNVSFAGVACVYNSNPFPLSAFVLVSLDPNLMPIMKNSAWNQFSSNQARCPSTTYASCSFADSSNTKK